MASVFVGRRLAMVLLPPRKWFGDRVILSLSTHTQTPQKQGDPAASPRFLARPRSSAARKQQKARRPGGPPRHRPSNILPSLLVRQLRPCFAVLQHEDVIGGKKPIHLSLSRSWLADAGPASQHKNLQHLRRRRKASSLPPGDASPST